MKPFLKVITTKPTTSQKQLQLLEAKLHHQNNNSRSSSNSNSNSIGISISASALSIMPDSMPALLLYYVPDPVARLIHLHIRQQIDIDTKQLLHAKLYILVVREWDGWWRESKRATERAHHLTAANLLFKCQTKSVNKRKNNKRHTHIYTQALTHTHIGSALASWREPGIQTAPLV